MKNTMIAYGRQQIDEADIQEVADVLRSDWLTQGPSVAAFENALGTMFGSSHVAAVCNGTAALHLAALALGWGPGDVVITTPMTFLASANCILYAGASPMFVDIDPRTYTIDVNKLEDAVKAATAGGGRIKAVVAVDYAGQPCDWTALRALANRYEFQTINDNCHAAGAEFNGSMSYAAAHADAAVMSFHPVKHITTGEGGAVLTNDADLDRRVKMLRTHGMTKDPEKLENNDGPWYYEMHDLGFNYRITDFQCALGTSQLSKLARFLARRREIATLYDNAFGAIEGLTVPALAPGARHAYHLYPLAIDFEHFGVDKRSFFPSMREKGIACQVHYIPVHLQPYYAKRFGYKRGDYPVAEVFYSREVSIPMYPGLTDEDVAFVIETIKGCLA